MKENSKKRLKYGIYIWLHKLGRMGLGSKVSNEWKDAGIIERTTWLFGIAYPIIHDYGGNKMVYPIIAYIIYPILIGSIILNARSRHKNRRIELALINEKDKSATALEKVYAQKNKEIDSLTIEKDALQVRLDAGKSEIDQLRDDAQWLSDKYQLYWPIIEQLKESKKLELGADIILSPTSPDEVRFGKIQEDLKK